MGRGKLLSWLGFFFFLPLLNLKIKRATTFEVALQPREFPFPLFWSCPPAKRVPLPKKTYLPLPLSILAGTNLITLILFFLQPPFDSQENPSPIWFPGKFILVWFPRKSIQNPQRKPKNLLFFCSLCFLDLF